MNLLHGDCIEMMQKLDDASIDAIVTDPPYGLEFMGKEWDGADGFRRSLNPADTERDSVFGRTSKKAPEFSTGRGTLSKPGIGERETEWPTHQGWNARRCANCGHLPHGGSPCSCDNPSFVMADNRWPLFQQWCEAWATEALRVLKPGGHMLAFGGTRTYHRLACAIEDAGFEIRDSIDWLYGSGFPKSMDVSKAIDKAAGAERTVVVGTRHRNVKPYDDGEAGWNANNTTGDHNYMAPATSEAERWQGWGTALKPAHEPIVLARKPLIGTVAKNVLAHGTGALNIDECRVDYEDDSDKASATPQGCPTAKSGALAGGTQNDRERSEFERPEQKGRWPANVILDEEAGALLDEQTGTLTSGKPGTMRLGENTGAAYGAESRKPGTQMTGFGDKGGASRFFYCAKASKSERNAGLAEGEKSTHPTVKPVALMRYLVRLITPPGGTVLDPFMGSGTTGIACGVEGFEFVGIEKDDAYLGIAEQRIAHACPIDGDASCPENDHLFAPRDWEVEREVA